MMSITAHAQYRTADPADENDPDAPRFWEETEVKIPTAPPSKDLKPFYVSSHYSIEVCFRCTFDCFWSKMK